MKVYLTSPVTGFQSELFDVLNLFFGSVDKADAPDDADLRVYIKEELLRSERECTVSLNGLYQADVSNTVTLSRDLLEAKRLHKRQQKLGLFHALMQATGIRPPWGALTGVRPTRLVMDAMAGGQSVKEAVRQVQNVFCLSDEKARLLLEIVGLQTGLPQAKPGEIACYIGIPFCRTRCSYCSFLSREAGDGRLLPDYVNALIHEVEGTIRLMKDNGLTARSVYVGGGTPTVLPEDLLHKVLTAAQPLFDQAQERTVEAGRPDSITKGSLQVIKDAGVQRISVNPQSLHDSTLETISRQHTSAQTLEAFSLARRMGFSHINMDLIAGLPGEDVDMFTASLSQILKLAPEAITVHTLSIKRSSALYRKGVRQAEDAQVGEMVQLALSETARNGYQPYYLYRQKHMAGNQENVGYAKPGYACLYNIDMMEDHTIVLAMGAGAVSKWVSPGRERVLRSPNVKDVHHYLARVDEMMDAKKALFKGIGKGVKAPESQED
ncbi:MAG: coproporphyrinogen dehydrogenase HemZ [Clostridiales bacterium]|nr:coproporphyrinogen dehydrogenase HemZ [Clostridiales bacterium]